MNDWKELEIGNLPPDILTGEYEWQMLQNIQWVTPVKEGEYLDVLQILNKLESKYRYRYRRPEEPKRPTHKEIMTKWWKIDTFWVKVIGYKVNVYYLWGVPSKDDNMPMRIVGKEVKFFIDKESTDLPQKEMFAW